MTVTLNPQAARRPGTKQWPLSHVTPPVRALAESPAMMRPHVRAVLAGWGMPDRSDTAELIVTELVTNVLLAPLPSDQHHDKDRVPLFRLGLFSDRRTLLIEVFDTVPGQPKQRRADTGDEHGRGLAIVEALSQGWGTRRCPGGKIVYARLAPA